MGHGFFDVGVDEVLTAGRRTSGTAGDWTAWKGRVESELADGLAVLSDGQINEAFATYAGDANQVNGNVAQQTDNLGICTWSAGAAVSNGDTDAAYDMRPAVATAHEVAAIANDQSITTGVV